MRRRFRLRRRLDFQAVLAAGRIYSSPTVVGFARPRPTGAPGEPALDTRVGVTVSRQVRGAVHRNRARRRLREAARARLWAPDSPLRERGMNFDIVLIARPAALTAPFAQLVRDVEALARRVSLIGR